MKELSTTLTIFQSCLREFPKQPFNPSNNIALQSFTDLSDAFNEHFSTIRAKLTNEIPAPAAKGNTFLDYPRITNKRFHFTQINVNQALTILNKLSQSQATALDKISARLIRENTDLICIPISKIFNSSLTSGVFPNDGECAKVTPLLNQGSSNDMNNYRPRHIRYL